MLTIVISTHFLDFLAVVGRKLNFELRISILSHQGQWPQNCLTLLTQRFLYHTMNLTSVFFFAFLLPLILSPGA